MSDKRGRGASHSRRIEHLLASVRTEDEQGVDFVRRQIAKGLCTRERACDHKIRFARYDHAMTAKDDLEARHGDAGKLTVYPCPFCTGFHFATSKEFKT